MHLRWKILLFSTISCACALGQSAADSAIVISKTIDEVEVIQTKTPSFVRQEGNALIVNAQQLGRMPKFLGTSDPVRYLQSLPGVQTNNETSCGIRIQGCDDYHTGVGINGAPVYYPNHLLGLYSTFIASHFSTMTLQQSMHRADAANRLGGLLDVHSKHVQPQEWGIEGNIGLISSDLTLTLPCGKKSALWFSARASYINMLYSKLMKFSGIQSKYDFQDANLTYALHPSEKDEVVVNAFYSHDKVNIDISDGDVSIPWHNLNASVGWTRQLPIGTLRNSVSFSGFQNNIHVYTLGKTVDTDAAFAGVEYHGQWKAELTETITLQTGADYVHYVTRPLSFTSEGLGIASVAPSFRHAPEVSLWADMAHRVTDWLDYSLGVRGSVYGTDQRAWGSADPRLTLQFHPAAGHTIALHYGLYHQYFHKLAFVNGGLPADFFVVADSVLPPERAHSVSLSYRTTFYNDMFSASAETYCKQLYNVAECTGNILSMLNANLDYIHETQLGKGRNYGLCLMLQKNTGYVTGHIAYTLGWAKRCFPGLEGFDDYRYNAAASRRHDLTIVLNSQVAKKWNIGAMFVCASGIPYTEAKEAYMLNGQMILRYGTYNGAHLAPYHRLDLTCSYDIIRKNGHLFGVNVSLYNVYAHKNAQFVVYRDNLQPIHGMSLSTIIPSLSFYGKF